jgi:hypothetical protein
MDRNQSVHYFVCLIDEVDSATITICRELYIFELHLLRFDQLHQFLRVAFFCRFAVHLPVEVICCQVLS